MWSDLRRGSFLSWVVLAVLVISNEASTCSKLSSCTECNAATDADGQQLCVWCVKSQSCVTTSVFECIFGDKITKQDDCPYTEPPGVYYNDTFARNEMFAISAAAYFDNPQDCMTNFIEGAQVRRQVTVQCDISSRDRCSAFTAISQTRRAMILGFRGSDGATQLFLEGWETAMTDKVDILGGGKVSEYFYNAFHSVWLAGIREDFMDMVRLYSGYELWISGHSLGGAAASIASQVIVYGNYYDGKFIKLLTFGQPRTGDHEFTAAHDKKIPYSYRVTHARDMVVHLPPRSYKGYHHHRYEVWYDNDMTEGETYTECYTPDDDRCSDSNTFDISIDNHEIYFNKKITWIGGTGCIEA